MRPRSVGTFLISRPETSAKLCGAAQDALDVLPREVVDGEQVPDRHAATSACSADGDLVHAVDLLDAYVHALRACCRQVLAHVVGADRQLAVAAVGQHGQLHAVGAAVVEQGVDRGADRAAGVEHVVHQHDGHAVEGEVDVRVEDHRLAFGPAGRDVVAVEGDVEVAERHRGVDEALHALSQARRYDRAAPVDAHHGDAFATRLLDDLVCDAHERAANVLAVEYDLLVQNCPS